MLIFLVGFLFLKVNIINRIEKKKRKIYCPLFCPPKVDRNNNNIIKRVVKDKGGYWEIINERETNIKS